MFLIGPGSARVLQRVADRLQPDHAIAENVSAQARDSLLFTYSSRVVRSLHPTPGTDILEVNRYYPGAHHGR